MKIIITYRSNILVVRYISRIRGCLSVGWRNV